jgi:hypothetical protein
VRTLLIAAILAVLPAMAAAQEDGVLNSAETINPGNFKLMVHPMLLFGDAIPDTDAGVTLRVGYGLMNNADVEGKFTFYDEVMFFAADGEVWLRRGPPFDFSLGGGFHYARTDRSPDFKGFDITAIVSRHLLPRLELYGALDTAFNWYNESAGDFRTFHIVPGIEYAVADDIDLLVEVGVGLNDRAAHYLSGGLAFYLR